MGSTCISGMLCKETLDRKRIARARWESLCPPETWDVYNSLVKWDIRWCIRFSGGGCCRWLNDVQIFPAVSTVSLNIHMLSGTLWYSSKYSGYSRLYDPFPWQLTLPCNTRFFFWYVKYYELRILRNSTVANYWRPRIKKKNQVGDKGDRIC